MKGAALALLIASSPACAAEFALPLEPAAPLAAPVTGAAVLARADALGVPLAAIAGTLKAAASLDDAASGLKQLGLIKGKELRFDSPANVESSRAVLQTLWHESSPATAAPAVDLSLPVAALVAEKDGVAYHIHGVAHGQYVAPQGGRVRKLVRALSRRGAALYSEQNLPKFYGYRYGLETLDHAAASGGPAPVVELGGPRIRAPLLELIARVAGLAGSSLRGIRDQFTRLERAAGAAGRVDLALYFGRLRELYHPSSDARALFRVELPMPLKDSSPATLARSRAMAEAIAADARARGLTRVHILTGINHADELAYFLTSKPTYER